MRRILCLGLLASCAPFVFSSCSPKEPEPEVVGSSTETSKIRRSDGRSIEGLKTQIFKSEILAVYKEWGIVTLSDGDKNGVVCNSTLDVMRDGEVIAKLVVGIVERENALANIVPGSLAPDTYPMIGDTVVLAEGGMPAEVADDVAVLAP